MLLFGQTSLVGPLANAVAIPLVGFFITPLTLLGSVLPAPLAEWLLLLAHQLLAWLAIYLDWLVGQGTAVLVETAGHRLLYDTGPAYSSQSDAGGRVLLPYLADRGISSLDMVVISHNDNDHSGGALSLFDNIRVKQTMSSLPLNSALLQVALRHQRCMDGQRWEWDGAIFEMLQPAPVSYESSKWKSNDRSCALKVTLSEHAILLPGDIGRVQEIELLENMAHRLPATVLLAPHHGSGSSSTHAFLVQVAPRLAIFQVGHRNRYRHPKTEVYERYGLLGIERLRTGKAGAVMLRFQKGRPRFEQVTERQRLARHWHEG